MVYSNDAIRPIQIAGEDISFWLAFALALLGVFGSVVTARLIVPYTYQTDVVVPWVANLFDSYRQDSGLLSNAKVGGLIDESLNEDPAMESADPAFLEAIDMASLETNELPTAEDILPDDAPYKGDNKPFEDKANDCPPLFILRFKQGGVEPLATELEKKVAKLDEWLRIHPNVTIEINGYSSSLGSDEFNLLLSYRRSKAVSNLLTKAGISEKQLTIRAFGEQVPLAGEPSRSVRNRRVSMRVDGAAECSATSTDRSNY